MADRYRKARAMGRLNEVVREDTKLLQQFGLHLLSVEGGVRAAIVADVRKDKRGRPVIHPWNIVRVEENTWGWLHPLLCRLRRLEAQLDEIGS